MITDTPAASGDVFRMPYEGAGTTEEAAAASLLAMDSDEDTPDESEPQDAEADDEDETDTGDDSEADEEQGSEDEEEAEEADEQPDTPAKIKVKIDGEEVEVTLEELTKGYSRQADYTKKTMALAEKAKAIEAEVSQTRAERERYAMTLAKLDEALASTTPAEPDWARLREENPAEYAAQREDWRQRELDKAAVQAERVRMENESAREQEAQFNAYVETQIEALSTAIPEWKDPEKAGAEKKSLMEYARTLGYTDEDLGQVYDHRLILLLRDAKRYADAIKKGKQQVATSKVVPKVLQPGSRDTSVRPSKQKALATERQRLKNSGDVRDAARLIEMMDD